MAPQAVASQASGSKVVKDFRMVNYPDNTIYPESPADLTDKCWSTDKEGVNPTRGETLLVHLLRAILVGTKKGDSWLRLKRQAYKHGMSYVFGNNYTSNDTLFYRIAG